MCLGVNVVVLMDWKYARISLRSCFRDIFYYTVPLIEGSGCGKPCISSSKTDDFLHVPIESLMHEIPQSTLQALVILCSQGTTRQVVLISVLWTLRNGSVLNTQNIYKVCCAWAQDAVLATAAPAVLTRACWSALCTQGPKRLKASKVAGTDSWHRTTAGAL